MDGPEALPHPEGTSGSSTEEVNEVEFSSFVCPPNTEGSLWLRERALRSYSQICSSVLPLTSYVKLLGKVTFVFCAHFLHL